MNKIADRIAQSLAAGELKEAGKIIRVNSDYLLADVLRPYEEVFGVSPDQGFNGSPVQSRRPCFVPQNRRTKRPLPLPPKPLFWPQVRLSSHLWDGLRAMWEFCRSRDQVAAELLQVPLAKASEKLAETLETELSDYWPLSCSLETWSWEESKDNEGIHLYLPCFSYREEGVWSKEAFLSGPEAVASLLHHVYTECEDVGGNWGEEDHQLIDEIGWKRLVESYADSQQEKSCDLRAIKNFGETFFRPKMSDRSWEMMELYDPPIIDGGNGGNVLLITEKEEIEFALEFAEGFYEMDGALPTHGFECDEEGEASEFIKEVLTVWKADQAGEERKKAA